MNILRAWPLLPADTPTMLLARCARLERCGWSLTELVSHSFEQVEDDLYRRVPGRVVLSRNYHGELLKVPGETLAEAVELAERLQKRAPRTTSAVPVTTGRQVG
jgi:hypothetical protein